MKKRKTLKEQITSRCRHYEPIPIVGPAVRVCAAGVDYDTLGVRLWEGPCFREGGTCAKASYPTEAEADAEIAEMDAAMQKMINARAAIVASKKPRGEIDCPSCGTPSSLRFSVASLNGHVHAACKTKGCVSWME